MKHYQFIIFSYCITMLCADNQTAVDILINVHHHMDGINHSFKVDSKNSGKNNSENHFQIFVNWPSDGEVIRQIRVTSIDTKKKKLSSYWEHRFRHDSKAKKWMTLPITGKLKDVSNKKSRKKDFSFSELEITQEEIKTNLHYMHPKEQIGDFSAYVVKSIKKNKNGNIQKSKKIWIDSASYTILKVEMYTRRDRLFRTIECSNFQYIDKILFPLNITVQDLKSKTDIRVTIKEIELYPEFDKDIFIPQDQ